MSDTPGKPRVNRKLAAILAADIAGYSSLMSADETRTVRDLKAHQSVILPLIGTRDGRVIDTAGDGILAEFGSVVNAVECAITIQKIMAERNATVEPDRQMKFRIGINLGDIIHDEARVYGDGVNVAARLESIAHPGGITVSAAVHDQVHRKLPFTFTDIGAQSVKNIADPVHVYHVNLERMVAIGSPAKAVLSLPDKPSIAVLPFTNIGGDPEQEYFADGMVEEIITALSRFSTIFVIARNSSFTYKGRNLGAKQIGQELGVRYLVEGSVRKAETQLRLTGQLVDASSGVHLWAQRFDGSMANVFDLQDQMTANIVGAIMPTLSQAEFERTRRKPTGNLDAYDCYMRGLSYYYTDTRDGVVNARQHFWKAMDLDPHYALAHALAAMCIEAHVRNGWIGDFQKEIDEAKNLAHRAVELGRDDASALAPAGFVIARVLGDLDDGAAFIDRALSLNANLARAWQYSGWVRIWLGEPELAIEHAMRAMRFNPVDPWLCSIQTAIAFAHFFAGRDDDASHWAIMALRERPQFQPALRLSAASHAMAGDQQKARSAMERLRILNPDLRLSNLEKRSGPQRRPEFFSRYKHGLQLAGLPE
jgi:TolB-like protein/class 3 adenylate cyclase